MESYGIHGSPFSVNIVLNNIVALKFTIPQRNIRVIIIIINEQGFFNIII